MYGHWEIEEDFDPNEWFGFTYLITNLQTGRKYIGRKQLRAKNRKAVKGRKNRKVCISESNWKEYTSSCNELKDDITRLGKENFSFSIIKLCKTKRELGYAEVEEQFAKDVLNAKLENGERAYYNSNIMSRWFYQNENTVKKMQKPKSDSSKMGRYERTEEIKKKLRVPHPWSIGDKNPMRNPEYVSKLKASAKGRIGGFLGKNHSEETRLKIGQSGRGKHNHSGANNPNYKSGKYCKK